MRRNYSNRRSREEMAMIVAEYETSTLSRREIAKKYGISSPTSITNWSKRLRESEKSVPLHRNLTSDVHHEQSDTSDKGMEEQQYNSLEEEVKALRHELALKEKELDWEKKRTMALETLIDVAEENGMHVKKYGARQ